MSVSDVTLIWETETDVQYTACNALYCVMQPLTADSGPFDLPPPAIRDSEQAFVQNSQFANILPARGDSRRQSPDMGTGVSQDIFAAVDTREDIVPQKLYQKTWQLWFFFTFGFMKN